MKTNKAQTIINDETSNNLEVITEDDKLSTTLQEPIKRGKTTIDKVKLRVPKSGELRNLALADLLQMEVNALKVLLPRISSPTLTEQEITQLHPADLVQLGGKVISFLVPQEKPISQTV